MIARLCLQCHARTITICTSGATSSAAQPLVDCLTPPASQSPEDLTRRRCQQCGYKWFSAKKEAPPKRGIKVPFWMQPTRWRQRFYQAYQEGDLSKAKGILNREQRPSRELESAYKALRRADRIDALLKYTTWLVLAYYLIRLLVYIGHRTASAI